MSVQIGNLYTMLYAEVQAELFNTFFSAEEKLLSLYYEAYQSIITDIAGLYEKYSVDGKLTYAQMSKFNRLKTLEKQISAKLHPEMKKSDEYIKQITGMIYEESFYRHAWAIDQDAGAALKWGILRDQDIEAIVSSPLSKLSDSKNLIADRAQAVYQVRKAVTLGLVRGEGYPEMAKRIREVIGIEVTGKSGGKTSVSATGKGLVYKSRRIVRTEGQRAVVEGQQKAYERASEEGIDLVQVWDAALDSRTRPEHGALDGKRKQEQGWYVSGIGWVPAPMQSGVASFDIHCRCRIRGQIKGYPPKVRGQKGNGQQPWVDYDTWKHGVKEKGSAKSFKAKEVIPPPPPKISEIPAGNEGAKAFGSRLQKIDKQVGGSTGAQVFKDDEGQEWILKAYKGNSAQVRNEFVANQLYQKVGISVPEARLAQVGEQLCIASKSLEQGYATVGWKHIEFVKDAAKAKRGFVMDAYLGNWDVAGMDIDNLMWKDGKISTITRIDQGGTLLYRAQGGLKGKAFGPVVDELQSLRNPGVNHAAASLFKKVTDSDIAGQIVTLKNRLNDEQILTILKTSGMDKAVIENYRTLLSARLKYLKDWEREFRKKGKTHAPAISKSQKPVISDPLRLRTEAVRTYDTSFSATEQQWMKRYTGSGYRAINKKALKGQFTTDLDGGIEKLPLYDGYVGRGIAQITDIEKKFAKWKSGEWSYVEWKAYSSTTITPNKQFNSVDGYMAVIRTTGKNKAGYINGRSSVPSEDEYLFAPGAKFRVAGWAESPNKRYRTLLLEEVEGDIPKSQAAPKKMDYEEIMDLWKKDLMSKRGN